MVKPTRGRDVRAGSNDTVGQWVPAPIRAASTVLFVQVGFVLVAVVGYLVRLVRGESTDRALLLGLLALSLVAAAGLVALARGLLRGAQWPRTPAVVWNLLLLPVGVSLLQAGQSLLGVATLVLAGVAIVGVVLGARGASDTSVPPAPGPPSSG